MIKSTKLPPLPPSKNKWWKDAEKFQTDMSQDAKCDHFFVRKTGSEIACKQCNIGFYVNRPSYIKNGKLVL